jgi:hypothetical protein
MRCRVLYDFTGENDAELSVREGEEVDITDKGEDDGWWHARYAKSKSETVNLQSFKNLTPKYQIDPKLSN